MIAEPRDGKTKVRFLAAIAIGGDQIVSMSDLGDESADILRIVLEIAVEHDNPIAARNTHTGSQRGDLTVIAVELDNSKAAGLADHALQPGKRAICRPVVNHDDLGTEIERREYQGQFVQQFGNDLLFVVHRAHDAEDGPRRRWPG